MFVYMEEEREEVECIKSVKRLKGLLPYISKFRKFY